MTALSLQSLHHLVRVISKITKTSKVHSFLQWKTGTTLTYITVHEETDWIYHLIAWILQWIVSFRIPTTIHKVRCKIWTDLSRPRRCTKTLWISGTIQSIGSKRSVVAKEDHSLSYKKKWKTSSRGQNPSKRHSSSWIRWQRSAIQRIVTATRLWQLQATPIVRWYRLPSQQPDPTVKLPVSTTVEMQGHSNSILSSSLPQEVLSSQWLPHRAKEWEQMASRPSILPPLVWGSVRICRSASMRTTRASEMRKRLSAAQGKTTRIWASGSLLLSPDATVGRC